MDFVEIKADKSIDVNEKTQKKIDNFKELISEIKKKKITKDLYDMINEEILLINSIKKDKVFPRQISKSKHKILLQLQRKLKIIKKDYHKNMWLSLGMSSFGLPIGLAFSLILDNFVFLAIGLPIGMMIGLIVGTNLDKKAKDANLVLNIK